MSSTDQPGDPSPEELRAYLDQLREAPAAEIVIQAYTMLGTGAEVKLGRPDARLLIDAMAGLAQAVGPRFGGDLGAQMQNGVAQLQMAQVEAERQAGQQAAPATPPPAGADREAVTPAGTAAGAPGPAAGRDDSAQRMTDRLWIPGRDPGPQSR